MFIYEENIIFTLDGNSDNFRSFYIATQYFKNNFKIIERNYYPPFWEDGIMDFEVNGISIEISFHGMLGTSLSINKNLSEDVISKVTEWCKIICKEIIEYNEKNQYEIIASNGIRRRLYHSKDCGYR